MNELQPTQFFQFFQELYPYPPMAWQTELAKAACNGKWPDYVCLPTGAGKTSTIDIALFALAYQADWPAEQRTAPMRTFLVVDRRTVVSEAFYRAKSLQQELTNATDGILKTVADRLRRYAIGEQDSKRDTRQSPLSVVELRGGIYRDPAWCQSLTEPMIVTSTVDQVGSRLLFRGYGVSNSARPIQAAAVAHDSLIILDEAHISPAFSETLNYVRKYQRSPWSSEQVPMPMRVVEMTATPSGNAEASKIEINPAELADETSHIGRIVNTSKPATLEVASSVKGAKAPAQLAKVLVERAIETIINRDSTKPDQPTAPATCSRVDSSEPTALAAGEVAAGEVGDEPTALAAGEVAAGEVAAGEVGDEPTALAAGEVAAGEVAAGAARSRADSSEPTALAAGEVADESNEAPPTGPSGRPHDEKNVNQATESEASGTKPEASATRPEVSATGPEASATGPEVSATRPEVSATRPEASACGSVGNGGTGPEASACGSRALVVAIMCNMVATAKEVWTLLRKNKTIDPEQVHLIIGAMRPIDRDKQTDALRKLISTGANRDGITTPIFVVATQCIEVGADYDFDILVTEAAPLDSLIQRFGRLNRAGRPIRADAHIIMRGDRVKDDKQLDSDDKAFKTIDPIYGNAMSRTWNWLTSVSDDNRVDFGIAPLKNLAATIDNEQRQKMSTESSQAPVLMPAHLDLLSQTSINPWPDPDVSLWLHGPQRNDPEVQVCWRADLVTVEEVQSHADAPIGLRTFAESAVDMKAVSEKAVHTISLCPPSTSECLSVPLRRVQAWLNAISKQKKVETDQTADLPALIEDREVDPQSIPAPFRPIAWRGLENSEVVRNVRDIRPGDTLVFPVAAGGWSELGFIPDYHSWSPQTPDGTRLTDALHVAAERGESIVECKRDDFPKLAQLDRGNEAFAASRDRPILRLHPNLIDIPQLRELYTDLRDPDFRLKRDYLYRLVDEIPDELVGDLRSIKTALRVEYYADQTGVVISGPRSFGRIELLAEDDGSDLYSRIIAGQPVELSDHLLHVRSQVKNTLEQLPLDAFQQTLLRSAEVHDWGKADPRFQAMLLGGDLYSAFWETKLYAKSAKMPSNLREREFTRSAAELPQSFRHEMLSMSLAETAEPSDSPIEDPELVLHLIATHHGHGRPWVPVCDDPTPPDVSLVMLDQPDIALSVSDRQAISYHRIDSPVAERFQKMIEKYGWWGVAFLECVLRLADRRASQIEAQIQAGQSTNNISRVEQTGGTYA